MPNKHFFLLQGLKLPTFFNQIQKLQTQNWSEVEITVIFQSHGEKICVFEYQCEKTSMLQPSLVKIHLQQHLLHWNITQVKINKTLWYLSM